MPGGFFTKIGLLVLVSLLVGVLVFDFFSADQPATSGLESNPASMEPTDHRAFQTARERVAGETRRVRQENAARAQDELRRQTQQRQADKRTPPRHVAGNAHDYVDPDLSEEEYKLQQALRLEEIERRRRSLRSEPLVKSTRTNNPSASMTPAATAAPSPPASPQEDPRPKPERNDNLDNLKATLALLNPEAGQGLEADHELVPPQGPTTTASLARPPNPDYQNPPVVSRPADPPGWERIYEGSFLEAVLVTQLSGDFPGPVLAQVSVPFYSRDRQQILVPRGARLVGTAQQVTTRDQGRLSVGFHRLIFPDGRWLTLTFLGLNQLGESGLKDRINRHYLSLFAATGAVGLLSGLTLRGGDPYRGGLAGFRSGAGQGLGQGAMRIMDRFLNRLPTITIRAGHRLRIWFTSDVLLPRA